MYVNTLITLQENLSTYGIDGKKITGHVTITSPGLIKCYVQNLKKQGSGQTYALYAFSKAKDKGVRLGNLGSEKETKWIINEKNIQNSGINLEELDGVAIVVEDDMRGADTVLMGFKNNRYMIIPLIDDIFKKRVKPGKPGGSYEKPQPKTEVGHGMPSHKSECHEKPQPKPEVGHGMPSHKPECHEKPQPKPEVGHGMPSHKPECHEKPQPKPEVGHEMPSHKPECHEKPQPKTEAGHGMPSSKPECHEKPQPKPEVGHEMPSSKPCCHENPLPKPPVWPGNPPAKPEEHKSSPPRNEMKIGMVVEPDTLIEGPGPVIVPNSGMPYQGGPGPVIPNSGMPYQGGPGPVIPNPGMPYQGGPGPVIPNPGMLPQGGPGPVIIPGAGVSHQGGQGPVIPNPGMPYQGGPGPVIPSPGMPYQGGPGPAILNPGMPYQGGPGPVIPNPGMPYQGGPGPVIPNPGMPYQGGPGPVIPNPGMPYQGGPGPVIPNPGMPHQGGPGPVIPNPGMPYQGGQGPVIPNPGMPYQGGPGPVIPNPGIPPQGGPGSVIVPQPGMSHQGIAQQVGYTTEAVQNSQAGNMAAENQNNVSEEQDFTKVKILDKKEVNKVGNKIQVERMDAVDSELLKIAEKLKQIGKQSSDKQEVNLEDSLMANGTPEDSKVREDNKNNEDDVSKELQRIINMLKENQEIKQKTKGIEEQIERMRQLPQTHKLVQKSDIEKTIESRYMAQQLMGEKQEDDIEEEGLDTSPREALNFMSLEKKQIITEEITNQKSNNQMENLEKKEDINGQDEIDYIYEIDKKIREIEAKRRQQENNK